MVDFEVYLQGGPPWGFRLQGGREFRMPIRIAKVEPGGKAHIGGIQVGDHVTEIEEASTENMYHTEALTAVKKAQYSLSLLLSRPDKDGSGDHCLEGSVTPEANDTKISLVIGPKGAVSCEKINSSTSDDGIYGDVEVPSGQTYMKKLMRNQNSDFDYPPIERPRSKTLPKNAQPDNVSTTTPHPDYNSNSLPRKLKGRANASGNTQSLPRTRTKSTTDVPNKAPSWYKDMYKEMNTSGEKESFLTKLLASDAKKGAFRKYDGITSPQTQRSPDSATFEDVPRRLRDGRSIANHPNRKSLPNIHAAGFSHFNNNNNSNINKPDSGNKPQSGVSHDWYRHIQKGGEIPESGLAIQTDNTSNKRKSLHSPKWESLISASDVPPDLLPNDIDIPKIKNITVEYNNPPDFLELRKQEIKNKELEMEREEIRNSREKERLAEEERLLTQKTRDIMKIEEERRRLELKEEELMLKEQLLNQQQEEQKERRLQEESRRKEQEERRLLKLKEEELRKKEEMLLKQEQELEVLRLLKLKEEEQRHSEEKHLQRLRKEEERKRQEIEEERLLRLQEEELKKQRELQERKQKELEERRKHQEAEEQRLQKLKEEEDRKRQEIEEQRILKLQQEELRKQREEQERKQQELEERRKCQEAEELRLCKLKEEEEREELERQHLLKLKQEELDRKEQEELRMIKQKEEELKRKEEELLRMEEEQREQQRLLEESLQPKLPPFGKAKYSFHPQGPGELPFKKGEIIAILEAVDENWIEGELNGTIGIFPVSYVELIDHLPGDNIPSIKSKPVADTVLDPIEKATLEYLKDEPNHDDVLDSKYIEPSGTLLANMPSDEPEVITEADIPVENGLFEHAENAVVEQELNSENIPQELIDVVDIAASCQPEIEPGIASARYTFKAESESELSFKKGDEIALLKRVDENWYEGELNGRIGILPVNYVKVAKEPVVIEPIAPVVPKPIAEPHNVVVPEPVSLADVITNEPIPEKILKPANTRDRLPSAESILDDVLSAHEKGKKAKEDNTTMVNGHDHMNGGPTIDDLIGQGEAHKVIYKYNATNEDEIELIVGDIVHVLEKCDDNWYIGTSERTGAFGTFPGNYVVPL